MKSRFGTYYGLSPLWGPWGRVRSVLILLVLGLVVGGCSTKSTEDAAPGETEEDAAASEEVDILSTDPKPPEEERQGFDVPPGFDVELVAAEPDIGKPFNMAFDAQGRLWTTQSCSYPFPSGKACDRITILEDTDGDGRADTFTEFADSLNIPIGVFPLPDGGAIAYSIPNLYRFYDDDGDGRADRREVLYGPFGYEDTHGMVNHLRRGYDGWIYACHGFSNRSVITGADGHTITMESGNTFRFRPDGRRVELVTTGRVNPSGLTFDKFGYHFSADSHSDPIYQLIPGGDYPSFHKEPTGIGFAPPMMDHGHPPTARAGIALYDAKQFPRAYRQNFFTGNVMSARIIRDSLVRRGSTPVAVHKDPLLTSEDPWFRPVDSEIGPDGALYVADFYNRIIGHYEVPLDHPGRDHKRGRIWRITYDGDEEHTAADAPLTDWTQADLEALVAGLGTGTVHKRLRVADQLVLRIGAPAAAPVEAMTRDEAAPSLQRALGLWVLYRLDALPRDLLAAAVQDSSAVVRTHTLRLLAERSTLSDQQHALVREALTDENAHVRRAAVLALAQHPRMASLEPLLALRHRIPADDTHLIYATRLSLRNHLRREPILQTVLANSQNEKDAHALADVTRGVNSDGAGAFLFDYIQRRPVTKKRLPDYVSHAVRYLPGQKRDALAAFLREEHAGDLGLQMKLFSAVRASVAQQGVALGETTTEWGTALATQVLEDVPRSDAGAWASGDSAEVAQRRQSAAEIASAFKVTRLEAPLERLLMAEKEAGVATRAAAARALLQLDPAQYLPRMKAVILDDDEPSAWREEMIRVVGTSASPQALASLLREVPLGLQDNVAEELAVTVGGAEKVLQAVREEAVRPRLLTDSRLDRRLRSSIPEASALRRTYEELREDLHDDDKQRLIEERLASFSPAEASVEDGRRVFTANCATCHQVNDQGGSIGPELDGIGSRSLEALATQILAPSRTVSRNFRTTKVTLTDGNVRFGLFRREDGEVLVFTNAQGEEFSIPKQEVAEREELSSSLMPDTFGEILPPDEFHDLLAYLQSLG